MSGFLPFFFSFSQTLLNKGYSKTGWLSWLRLAICRVKSPLSSPACSSACSEA